MSIQSKRLGLGNISKDFTINNMKRTRLKGIIKFLSVDFNPIDINDILYLHGYIMKKCNIK